MGNYLEILMNIPMEAKKIQENTSLIGSNKVFNYRKIKVTVHFINNFGFGAGQDCAKNAFLKLTRM